MPKNPISNEISPVVNAYVNPFFTQNWHLFSPNLLVRNDIVYMQVKYKGSSTPMIQTNYKNYLSPMNRMARIPMTEATMINGMNEDDRNFIMKLDTGHISKEQTLIQKDIEKRTEEQRYRMRTLLYRFASATAEKYFAGKQIESLRVRIVHEKPIPFSKRFEKDFKKERTHQDFEWETVKPVIPW
ncbi:DUF5819 family protein [Bacillus thuringiensis]|nr:DUF5819 family protein [Bacillus thuringiensis]MBG9632687.1 hypothetical protein [Bacillus thuringiensis]MBG9669429.1 hypothetical protein [Bacillus thuringiensis]MBH0355704.1 hypothetical protein [Bacillus thuringiensis]